MFTCSTTDYDVSQHMRTFALSLSSLFLLYSFIFCCNFVYSVVVLQLIPRNNHSWGHNSFCEEVVGLESYCHVQLTGPHSYATESAPQHRCLRSVLILSFHVPLRRIRNLIPSYFPVKMLHASPCVIHALPNSFPWYLIKSVIRELSIKLCSFLHPVTLF
jgi:hypothetical protein